MKKSTLLVISCGLSLLCACATETAESEYVFYENGTCLEGWFDTENTGAGDPVICCPAGTVGVDGFCVDQPDAFDSQEASLPETEDVVSDGVKPSKTNGFVLLSAPKGKGSAYCPERSNSLAWNGSEFKCCGKGMKSVAIPSRDDSICCPASSDSARWVGSKWNDYECCPEGTVETKNHGDGDKYVCCQKGQKAVDGECF